MQMSKRAVEKEGLQAWARPDHEGSSKLIILRLPERLLKGPNRSDMTGSESCFDYKEEDERPQRSKRGGRKTG